MNKTDLVTYAGRNFNMLRDITDYMNLIVKED